MPNNRYEAVPGYFLYDDPASFPMEAVPPRFGLNDNSNDRWERFFEGIRKLNEDAASNTIYKFFLLSRHGEGYHNVAETRYGAAEWDRYWSLLNGDGELVWGPDPDLTSIGIEQAQAIRENWVLEATFGIPPPHIRLCSPLTRALQTASITFDGTFDKLPTPVLIKENCRERNGAHTCDKRNTVSSITSRFPSFEIDASMTEDDRLWSATVRETPAEVAVRANLILKDIFETCDTSDTFISITAHSGFINGFLIAIGRTPVILPTGGMLAVVVKAEFD
jgi:broad specificity phosphatase PhoE